VNHLKSMGSMYAVALGGLILLLLLPQVIDLFAIYTLTLYVVLGIFTLSLAFIWGFGGILCFGQAAFFGLGGYVFAVSAINLGDTTFPFLLAILLPALFAAAVGYFMFYGRLSDVYMGVVTLVISLILYRFMSHTAGDAYAIGKARLGGFNGIPSVPQLNAILDPGTILTPEQVFLFAGLLLLLVYVGLRFLLRSHFGRVAVSIRENETRAQLLGYDARLFKLIVFTIGGGIAGMAGGLYATYQAFIDPNAFALVLSAQVLIWVIAGGLGTLVGPVLACWALQYVSLSLSNVPSLNGNIVLGAILMLIVLLLPKGLLPSLGLGLSWTVRQRGRLGGRDKKSGSSTATEAAQ
jgi:branched-chain amino acid transport system permease protein